MGRIPNNILVASLEKRVESHLSETVRIFQNLDENTLLKSSDNGGWSVAQCFWHLNSYGRYYLPLIGLQLELAESCGTESYFSSGMLGNMFANLMEPKPQMKKIKAFKNHRPPHIENPYLVIAEFIEQQETLLGYLRTAKGKNLNQKQVPISLSRFIKLKTGDVLRFLIAHNERHIQQAKRNQPAISRY